MATNAASSSKALTSGHGLTPTQLADLQEAVLALDAHLLRSVAAIRNNEWTRPTTRQIADYRVRELVVCFPAFLRHQDPNYIIYLF
jgi:hypothetical protein